MDRIKSCLIIDDDTDDQEIFLMCVKKIDGTIDCKTAHDGDQAIFMLTTTEDYKPDYIFLDVNMPKMNGIECLKEIRKIERLKDTKVYMYSTTTENNMVDESGNLGADDFIVKPIRTSKLKEKLYNIFRIVSHKTCNTN
jgi:PleD family two-component response regulator